MSVAELISELERHGIRLWDEGGRLRFRAPHGSLTDERRALLRANREAVLDHLRGRGTDVALTPDPDGRYRPFPLAEIQAAYLVGRAAAYDYGGVACHAYLELGYPADTEPDRLDAAWWRVVERHDMLCAVVHPDGHQQVLEHVEPVPVPVEDLRGADAATVAAAIDGVRSELGQRVARSDRWPLFALRMTRTDTALVLHLSIDMLVVDYASLQLVLAELEDAYRGRELAPIGLTFRDYLLAHRRARRGSAYDRDRHYWMSRIDELPPGPDLPVRADPADAGGFRRLEATIGPEDRARLQEHAAALGVTVSIAVLTAYAETIGRWSRSPRFCLNVPTFSRLPVHEDVDRLVGDFTSVELLAVDLTESQDFATRAGAIGAQLLDDLAHTRFSGSEVLAEMSRRSEAGTVLMPVVYTSTLGGGATRAPEAAVRYAVTQTPQVWIDCQTMERSGGLVLSWDVREGVLPDGTVEDMFAAFTGLVAELCSDEACWRRPVDIPLPAATEVRRTAVNATAGPLPDGLLQDRVLATAGRQPDAPAVRAGGVTLTYRELAERAAAVAHALRARGVEPGELVAVVMDKGPEQVTGVLGTLLAGAAYLPVDTNQPPLRRDRILADAAVRTVLTQSWVADATAWPEQVGPVAVDRLAPSGTPVPPSQAGPDDLAYVIYTSGSTGVPKGVMISHRAARNTVDDIDERFAVGPADRVLGLAQLGFDLSVYDIFGTLGAGGCLVLPDPAGRGDPSRWAELVAAEGVTIWNSVPGQLQMLHDYLRAAGTPLPSLRLAMLSGDWIPLALPDQIRALLPQLQLHSLGGATEASIWSIGYPIGEIDPAWRSIPYGRPLTNQTFHVLDHALRPCPDHVTGELYIGGAGVALGYLGDAERTAERFVRHPLSGERLYRTGDLGRYLPDGVIEFLGRVDRQVKLRGHRIELGEIQAALDADPAVGASVVLVDGENGASAQAGARRLAAFVEPARRSHPLPVPGAVAETAHETMRRATAPVDATALGAFLRAQGDAAVLSMARALAPAFRGEEPVTAGRVLTALGVDGSRAHLVGRWLTSLVAAGRLRSDGDAFRALAVPEPDEVDRAWERAAELERAAGWSADLFSAVRRCAGELDALLRGDRTIESVLFAGAPEDAMDAAYRGNVMARTLQQVIADGIREIAATHTGGPLRIMEVGLRGGGAAVGVLPALAGFDVDYLATDVSALTRAEAAQRWAGDERVRVAEFDAAVDVREQGLLPNSVDVLISAGVLNNVADVDAALARFRELAAPGGWLVLLENTDDANPALQISTEFLEAHSGPFTDVRAAGRQTFLRPEQWRDGLAARGARVVAEFPDPQSPLSAAGQRLFLVQLKPDREPVHADELARRVGTRLPDYMVPTRWQIVDRLPLTDNGKIDHKVLRAWLAADAGADTRSEQPVDELEGALAQLWAELLGCTTVGRHDDLFALGGDSLLVARLVGRLRDGLGDVASGAGTGSAEWDLEWEVVLRHLLRNPTVAGLASYLRTVQSPDGGAGAAAPASPVVWLNGAASDPLTVLVHAGTGTLLPYRPLVTEIRRRAGGAHNLVGLEIAAVDEFLDADPDGLVDRMAADYVKALQATGCARFDIVGYCVGGVIATEVARGLSESGADVRSLTLISSHAPRFRIDDEMLSEYSFALMMGMDLAHIGFPADEARVGAAAGAVLERTPDAIRDGAISTLTGEYADVAAAFAELEAVPRMRRVARMCEAVPPELAGTYEPEGMLRTLRIYQQSTFALSRHRTEPYAGDITFLRHSGAYPFPGTADSVTEHWARLCLGELRSIDIPGHHFSCMTAQYVDTVFGHLAGLVDGREGPR